MMSNQPASPGEGTESLPTPALPDIQQPATPGEGPEGLPTPSLPSQPPYGTIPTQRICPPGYRAAVVGNQQTLTDLLVENNVSYQALRNANPNLVNTRLVPGTRYCVPPSGSRGVCENGTFSYVMGQGENLLTLPQALGVSPGTLLIVNPTLAPSDFQPGRVICVP